MIEKEMTSREIKMFRLGKLEHAYKLGQKRLEKLNTGDAFKDLEEINKIFIEQKNITKKFLVLSEQLMPLSFKTHRVIKGLESQWG